MTVRVRPARAPGEPVIMRVVRRIPTEFANEAARDA